MNDLYRLVYTSFRADNCDQNEIGNILSSCKKNNPQDNLTGLLLHTDKKFIQVIEGDKPTVEQLYNKVKKDDRHWGVNLRSMQKVDDRAFPDWAMAFKDVSGSDLDYDTTISDDDKDKFESLVSGKIDFKDDEGVRILKLFMKTA